jgi:hypothetical protein
MVYLMALSIVQTSELPLPKSLIGAVRDKNAISKKHRN